MTTEQIVEIRTRVSYDGAHDEENRVIIARALPYLQEWNNRAEWVEIAEWLSDLIRDRRALLDQHNTDQERIAALEKALRNFSDDLADSYMEGEYSELICAYCHSKLPEHTDDCPTMIARAALKGGDDVS